ncbi:MAG: DUF4402 domain-containing protein [Nonlabens sp.]|uniref:DUF4402 domain-containing protein n=1 Tax=Nonlabens sp. TaxID=1888209 RepID=UPI0035A6FF23
MKSCLFFTPIKWTKKAFNINRNYKKNAFLIIIVICIRFTIYGQPSLPKRSLEVSEVQSLQFGVFLDTSNGGSVTVDWDGTRTATGSVILLDTPPYSKPAIFEISLLQGRNVYIDFATSTYLTGRNGGALIMNIGPTDKGGSGAFFSTSNNREFKTMLRVGGELEIPPGAIPGSYSGYYYITFNYE